MVYIISFSRCKVINKKTKYGLIKFTKNIIITSSSKSHYMVKNTNKHKKQPQGSNQVNSMNIRCKEFFKYMNSNTNRKLLLPCMTVQDDNIFCKNLAKKLIHCCPCSDFRCWEWQCDTFNPFRKLVHHNQTIGVI